MNGRYALISLLLVLSCAGAVVKADQNAPELRQLFTDLANAENRQQAGRIEQEIWSAWFASPGNDALETLNEARDAAESGAVNKAMTLFDSLVADYPNYAEGWNQRAIIRYLSGDVTGSLADVDRTLTLEPRHFGALSGRGQCYLRQELYGEALEAFEAAQAINPWITSTARQIEMLRAYIKDKQTPI